VPFGGEGRGDAEAVGFELGEALPRRGGGPGAELDGTAGLETEAAAARQCVTNGQYGFEGFGVEPAAAVGRAGHERFDLRADAGRDGGPKALGRDAVEGRVHGEGRGGDEERGVGHG
jgi:hypothetical protein